MHYITFTDEEYDSYPICFLIANPSYQSAKQYLIDPYELNEHAIVVTPELQEKGIKKTERVQYLETDLLKELEEIDVEHIVCTDATYYKLLTGAARADTAVGSIEPCVIKGYSHMQILYCPSPQSVYFNPNALKDIDRTLDSLILSLSGEYVPAGSNVITFEEYPDSVKEIRRWLNDLIDTPLSMDIEAWSLDYQLAGVATLGLAWSQTEGIAFCVDRDNTERKSDLIRAALKQWFIARKGKNIWHNAAYDISVLVREIFMEDMLDQKGLLEGIKCLTKDTDDTKLIAYLALNSCVRPKLGLKQLSLEYLGDYGEDVKNIDLIETSTLLKYNLKDCLGTFFTYNKYLPRLTHDNQMVTYNTVLQPALRDVIQLQLTGMPINYPNVLEAEVKLEADYFNAIDTIRRSNIVAEYEEDKKHIVVEKKNKKYKKKVISTADLKETDYAFNPNSHTQIRDLLFSYLGIEPIDLTKKKLASTNAKVLKKLKNILADVEELELVQGLIDCAAVSTILKTFIPAMKKAKLGKDGWHYLFGNFNIGGTLSGRLSSSNPNLQNLPSTGTKYAKIIKECFSAPSGWVFVGLDFDSLEDKISALTTNDPAKLKVYTDGYDGHSLRAYYYNKELFPQIDPLKVSDINSIQVTHEAVRQGSKPVTFALTYLGTHFTLHRNLGYPIAKAKEFEDRFKDLYKVSIQWVADKIEEATHTGYVTGAFGLRVRTPVLHNCVYGSGTLPYQAEKEARSAGNALGQSWGLLNNRAHTAFMRKVRKHPEYAELIRPSCQIHDAQYFIVKNDVDVLKWVNDNLVAECEWQDDPLIYHEEVKLSGKLAMYFPSWANEIKIPNHATEDEILDTFNTGYNSYMKKLKEDSDANTKPKRKRKRASA